MFFDSTRHEMIEAATKPHLWALLGWYDIKQRYRRSVLGPFWFTISTAVLIGTLGLLWSTLFKANLHEYMPYFATGNVIWTFVSMQLVEATTGFTQFENLIKQTRLPYPTYVMRLLCRNFIIFLHNFIIVVIVVAFVGDGWTWTSLLALPGMLLLSAVTLCFAFIFAILCTRYRDMVPVVQNLVTVAYFLTPIMWQEKLLPPKYQWASYLNPISHLLDIVRMPILGQAPTLLNWLVSLGLLVLSAVCAYALFGRVRHRIAYWL
jgi:lipopolysaccharide transport system permease protein